MPLVGAVTVSVAWSALLIVSEPVAGPLAAYAVSPAKLADTAVAYGAPPLAEIHPLGQRLVAAVVATPLAFAFAGSLSD